MRICFKFGLSFCSMKKSLTAVLMLGLGVCLSLLLFEGLFRAYMAYAGKATANSTDRPRIHFFSEKSKDTRDRYYEKEKAAGVYRIVVVGDSFAYGYGNLWDDAFPKRLERILNLNDVPGRVEVMNVSTPGHSAKNEVQAVRRVISEYAPDLILLEITLNDSELKRFNPHDKKDKKGSIIIKGAIYEYWKSLAYIVGRIKNTQASFKCKRYFQNLWKNEKTLSSFRVSYRKIAEIANRSKVKLAVVIFPLMAFSFDDSYPLFEAHRVIQELSKRNGLPYLDLFDAFRGLDPYRLQAIPTLDPHPNEIAHRIAAEAIYLWLKKERLIPLDSMVRYWAKKRIGPAKLKRRLLQSPKKRHRPL